MARSTWKVEQLAWFKVFVVHWCGVTLEIDSPAALPRAGKKIFWYLFYIFFCNDVPIMHDLSRYLLHSRLKWRIFLRFLRSARPGLKPLIQPLFCLIDITHCYALCVTPFFQNQRELLLSSIPSYSSCSVGSEHSGQPLIPTCMDEPWPCSLTAVLSLDSSGWIRTTASWKHLTGATVLELPWLT